VADAVSRQWGEGLVTSWNAAGWIDAGLRVGGKIARLIGARADEVVVADSTSINLFKVLVAAGQLDTRPGVLLTEAGNFPTDLYVAQGVAALLPHLTVRALPRDEIAGAIDGDTRLLALTHVHYKTAARFDMAALSARAHAVGALAIWDLSHTAGAVAVDLNEAGADLAVGCGYKYLNGGPGAPAFVFARAGLHERLGSPIPGWLGHAAPFDFVDGYAPAPGVARFQCGTPPILSMTALEQGVDLMTEAAGPDLWAKSAALFDLFATLAVARLPELALVSPADAAERGSHISFAHPHAHAMIQALIARGVVGDFRAPDILRFGLTPLYLGFADVWQAVEHIAAMLAADEWRDPRFAVRAKVT
jgi:kynureninase